MPAESERRSESDLRAALRGNNAAPARSLDTDEVIRRARRRRSPRQLAIGSVTALAVAAVVVVSVNVGQLFPHVVGSASDSALAPESATSGGSAGGPADLRDGGNTAQALNRCGDPVTGLPADPSGLELKVNIPDSSPADGQAIQGTVTLTNTGTERVTGTVTQVPAVTISRDGLTVWHSRGPATGAAALIELAPGQSVQFAMTMQLVACSAEDERAADDGGGFDDNLPALPSGTYQVSAVVSVLADGSGNGSSHLVSGPPAAITLH